MTVEFLGISNSSADEQQITFAGGKNRRLVDRSEFEYRFELHPADGSPLPAESIYVQGKDISPKGAGFRHNQPITYRKVRLVAADPRLADIGMGDLVLEVSLRWCRFVGAGRYESGGRVTRTTAPLF